MSFIVTWLLLADVRARLRCARSTVYENTKKGLLPPPIRLSERRIAWPAHEIEAIQRARLAGRTDEEIRALVTELVEARSKAA
jgi:prophage regulatory protein